MHPQPHHFNARLDHCDDWTLYPEPPTTMDAPQQQPQQQPQQSSVTYAYAAAMAPNMVVGMSPSAFNPTWPDHSVPFLGHSSPSPPSASDEADLQVHSTGLSPTSGLSPSSSTAGSPQSFHGQPAFGGDWPQNQGLTVVGQDFYPATEYQSQQFGQGFEEFQFPPQLPIHKAVPFDPTVIAPEMRLPVTAGGPYEGYQPTQASMYPPPPSPSMSSSPQPPHFGNGYPQFTGGPFQAPPVDHRRGSVISSFSVVSHDQPSPSGDEGSKDKPRCPHADCGRRFKDLKAHMITHQTERPEKCPILSCEYHTKGFARKYDKNRHTLTHYKGTMVCGFCPGSGSAAEKLFNRADVFKRHLTAVHGVEQTPPNSKKKSGSAANSGQTLTGYAPDATGKCSTCGSTFSNAQNFYEHLDECVLRQVQKEDPAEAVNARHMAEVKDDRGVIDTLQKNHLPITTPSNAPLYGEDEEDDEMCDEDEGYTSQRSPTRKIAKTGPANGIQKSKGMTHSRGGVSLPTRSRARKNRRDYPSDWGYDKAQMNTKKRVVATFDGPRRLAKDEMMLSTEQEVRIPLSDERFYVTDLDVQTMRRTEGFHQATEEEKGPWVSDDPTEEQRQAMLRHPDGAQ